MVSPPTLPPEVLQIAKAGLVVLGVLFVFAVAVHIRRYARADRMGRKVLRKAWFIKATWKRTARRVGLTQIEKARPSIWSRTPQTQVITRELVPRVTVHTERWGVRVDATTLGQLGLKRFQDSAIT